MKVSMSIKLKSKKKKEKRNRLRKLSKNTLYYQEDNTMCKELMIG